MYNNDLFYHSYILSAVLYRTLIIFEKIIKNNFKGFLKIKDETLRLHSE